MEKVCTKCNISKSLLEFGKGNDKDKLSYMCLVCNKEKGKLYRESNKDIVRNSSYNWKKNNYSKAKYYWIKNRALRKKVTFEFEINEFVDWHDSQEKICVYCGDNKKLAVDRVVPILGYIKNNVVLACNKCNLIKSDILSFDEMKEIAEKYIKSKLNKNARVITN